MITLLTWIHVLVSLAGIATGFLVVFGFLIRRSSAGWITVFLVTTATTSITGFFFPAAHFLPSHAVGILSLIVLAVAIYARHRRRLEGAWRAIFVAGAILALYLNVFVAVVQSFLKIPALKAVAPTQSEPAFKITQLVVLLLFVALGFAAVFRCRPSALTGGRKLSVSS